MQLRIINKSNNPLPNYETAGSAGMDLRAFLTEDVVLKPLDRKLIPTGLYIELPEGYEAQLRPRSGMAFKYGISLPNTPATIDSDYRGEVKIALINLSNEDFIVKSGERIVFTNGCFDILHAGHVRYLAQAKALGDRLVVGLNSDASVRRLKGEQRPINTLEDRATVLASLASVDWVVPFGDDAGENDTPLQLISTILPDVLVKGGDYSLDTIVGADVVIANGGEVQVLTFVDGRSTSKVIRKIQDLQGKQ